MSAQEWLVVALASVGTFFIVVASIGLNRMPDLLTRMHGAAKSTTLGITFVMIAVAVHFRTTAEITSAILVIIFFFITNPVGTHVLARAAYFRDIAHWSGTVQDDLAGHYDKKKHSLE